MVAFPLAALVSNLLIYIPLSIYFWRIQYKIFYRSKLYWVFWWNIYHGVLHQYGIDNTEIYMIKSDRTSIF